MLLLSGQGNSSKENLSSKRVDYEEEDAWKSYHRDRVRSESPGPSHRFSEGLQTFANFDVFTYLHM